MARKKVDKPVKEMLVIFVEGDADEIIINRLLDHYRSNGWKYESDIKLKNTHGFPDEKKIKAYLTTIIETMSEKIIKFKAVCCEYDTDVFEKGTKQRPDWEKIGNNLRDNYGVNEFCRIEAKTSIEDWMLDDSEGLLKVLHLPLSTNIKGMSGQDKVKSLFRKKNIMYDRSKGKNTIKKYLDNLDISKIANNRKVELKDFENILGVKNNDE